MDFWIILTFIDAFWKKEKVDILSTKMLLVTV